MELGAGRSSLRKWPRAGQPVHLCLVRPMPCQRHGIVLLHQCHDVCNRQSKDCKSAKTFTGFGPSRAARCQPQFTTQVAKGLAAVEYVTCAANTMFVMELWGSVTARTWIVCETVLLQIRRIFCRIWPLAYGSVPAAVHHASGQGPGSSFICALWGQGAGVHTLYPPPRHARQAIREAF